MLSNSTIAANLRLQKYRTGLWFATTASTLLPRKLRSQSPVVLFTCTRKSAFLLMIQRSVLPTGDIARKTSHPCRIKSTATQSSSRAPFALGDSTFTMSLKRFAHERGMLISTASCYAVRDLRQGTAPRNICGNRATCDGSRMLAQKYRGFCSCTGRQP
jgi:hypothetical protein